MKKAVKILSAIALVTILGMTRIACNIAKEPEAEEVGVKGTYMCMITAGMGGTTVTETLELKGGDEFVMTLNENGKVTEKRGTYKVDGGKISLTEEGSTIEGTISNNEIIIPQEISNNDMIISSEILKVTFIKKESHVRENTGVKGTYALVINLRGGIITETLELKDGDEFVMIFNGLGEEIENETYEIRGTYKVDGEKISLTGDDEALEGVSASGTTIEGTISNNEIIIPQEDVKVTFVKKEIHS